MTTHSLRMNRRNAVAVMTLSTLGAGGFATLPAHAATPTPEASGGAQEDPALNQTVSSNESVDTTPTIIRAGHVDIGPKMVDGQWTVLARDDSGSTPVWRDPQQVVLAIPDTALLDAPTDSAYDFMGERAGQRWWVIPQTQAPGIPWLGWNTQDPAVTSIIERGATMSIGPVVGPGRSWLFTQNGTFGQPLPLMDSQTDAPQDVWVDINTHVHANWVFSQPGVYLALLTFRADKHDGGTLSASTVVRFAVGDSTDAQAALSADASALLARAAEASASAGSESAGSESAGRESTSSAGAGTGSGSTADSQGSSANTLAVWLGAGAAILGGAVGTTVYRQRRSAAQIAQAQAEVHGES